MAGTENTKASELLHTPGGVRDIYGSACARKLEVQHSLEQVMHSYGFRNVQTPTFEYFDILIKNVEQLHPMRCLSSLTVATIH